MIIILIESINILQPNPIIVNVPLSPVRRWLYHLYRYLLFHTLNETFTTRGWQSELPHTRLKPGEGIIGHTFATNDVYVTVDYHTDPHLYTENRSQVPAGWGGNGTGYPRRLAGETIPLAARIFAVVDVYDALTSDRPYRPAWSKAKALEYIREQSGKYFDPRVVEAFLQMQRSAGILAKHS